MMQEQNFSSVILPLCVEGDEDGVLLFAQLAALRAGTTLSNEDIPVYVTASMCSREEVEQLLALQVRRVLIKPFKTRTLIDVLGEITTVASENVERVIGTSDPSQAAAQGHLLQHAAANVGGIQESMPSFAGILKTCFLQLDALPVSIHGCRIDACFMSTFADDGRSREC